jgi:phosphomannomutase
MSTLLADYFLKLHPGSAIVYDARNSRSVPKITLEHGGEPVITKVGHAIIKGAMREHDAPFGGEASGHFYFRDNWYADSGLIGAVIGLYVATLAGKKLSELREQYTYFAAIPERNFVVEDKDAAIARVKAGFAGAKSNTLDGITLDIGPDTWINVRPSNTESVLRLNVEAKSQAELDQLVDKVTALIEGEN